MLSTEFFFHCQDELPAETGNSSWSSYNTFFKILRETSENTVVNTGYIMTKWVVDKIAGFVLQPSSCTLEGPEATSCVLSSFPLTFFITFFVVISALKNKCRMAQDVRCVWAWSVHQLIYRYSIFKPVKVTSYATDDCGLFVEYSPPNLKVAGSNPILQSVALII